MDDELAAARTLLPGVRLRAALRLGSGERSTVQRVRATWPDGREASLVVKQFRSAGEGWVRESAALSVIPDAVRAPRVVAIGDAPPVMITEDLGAGPSVATALLGDDAGAARDAVVGWATAVAALHVATRDSREAFRAALDARQGDLPVGESKISVGLDDAVRVLDRDCGSLGVPVAAGAFDELRGLAQRLSGSTAAALTPCDTCPDNNVLTGDGLVLTDFEDAQWRHVAWDVAYLQVPWPTCWCSWRIPEDVADQAVAAYRRVASAGLPEVAEPGFGGDVEAAVAGWALLSTSWSLDTALGSDPQANPKRPTPGRRATIMHRLTRAARSSEVPALAELADRLAAELRARWGDLQLPLAPAFR
jgi:hypothetical protein